MTLRVSLEQASMNALTAFLTPLMPDVKIWSRWPEPNIKLPPKVITCVFAGEQNYVPLDPVLRDDDTEIVNATTVSATWSLGYLEQPIQLDLWATFDVQLDDMIARLDEILRSGASSLSVVGGDPFETDLLLELAGEWAGTTVDVYISQIRRVMDAEARKRNEYRAFARGIMTAERTAVREAVRLRKIQMRSTVHDEGALPLPAAENTTLLTVDPE